MEYPFLFSALLMGVLGSFHCVGMCGPLALALPLQNNSLIYKIAGILIYNLGRITTYAFFGLLFGWIGATFSFFGWQQLLSIITGSCILLFVLFEKQLFVFGISHQYLSKQLSIVRRLLSNLFQSTKPLSLFTIGILNGLLPCGLVYLAAAASITTHSSIISVLFMIAFGIGTVPAMFAISVIGLKISIATRSTIRKLVPFFIAAMGVLLIVRGLGIGIPYFSPKFEVATKTIDCCHPKSN
jgi:sulfite exporter TauE/SafE